jgi:PPM family protein phosphatase
MRLGEQAAFSDPGRKRRRNEDSHVVDPPLFVVADGMGGAQAGEVASRLATAAFREFHEADELAPGERLEAIIQEANRRIFERAQGDTGLSGMGTTVTAALLAGDDLTIGHVGDSRAYRIREGVLEQLTQDHSLVADLIRSGQLTPEEAEGHPQRSVITRVLGTDPDVDIDVFVVEAKSGDLFLICSDGLTSMVSEDAILKAVRKGESLEQTARALIKEANKRGGEDNITVVLFRVEEGGAGLDDTLVAGNGRGETEDLEDTLTGLEPPAEPRPTGWEDPADHTAAPHSEADRRRPRIRRGVVWSLLVLAVVGILVGAAFWGLSRAYFVGADEDGRVAVYQGLPWDLGGGARLYRARYVSQVRTAQLSAEERRGLFDHVLVSYNKARERILPYEEEATP